MEIRRRESKKLLTGDKKMLGTERARRAIGVPNIFLKIFYPYYSLVDLFDTLLKFSHNQRKFLWERQEDDKYV